MEGFSQVWADDSGMRPSYSNGFCSKFGRQNMPLVGGVVRVRSAAPWDDFGWVSFGLVSTGLGSWDWCWVLGVGLRSVGLG